MKRILLAIISCVFLQMTVNGQTFSYTPTSGAFTVPAAAGLSVKVQAWGGGGAGGGTIGSTLGARGGGGAGGGAYVSSTFNVSSGIQLDVLVAGITVGTEGASGNDGKNSTVTGTGVSIIANGGKGGVANTSGGSPSGGAGGTFASSVTPDPTSAAGDSGLSGSTGLGATSGMGGKGAGGGTGGAAISVVLGSNDGNNGNPFGGGGGGAVSSTVLGVNRTGGTGAAGQVIITYTCPTYSITSASGVNTCVSNGTSTITLTSSATGLPVGTYTVTYNTSLPSQTGLTAVMTVSVAGTGTFTATGLTTAGTSVITATRLTSGPCFTDISTNNTATITVNAIPIAPTLNPKTMECLDTSFVADWTAIDNATGYRLDVAKDAGFTIFVPGYEDKSLGNVTSDNVTGLTANSVYYVRLRALNTCGTSVSSSVITVSVPTTTYNGSWTSAPDATKNVIFASSPPPITTQLDACSCQINPGVNVVFGVQNTDGEPDVNTTAILKLQNGLDVQGDGTLTFEDNASLIQVNDNAVNSGKIKYKRQTGRITNFDYTYWSSPVSGQLLFDVSPYTLFNKFYSFNSNTNNWKQEATPKTTEMVKGIGYIIRGSQYHAVQSPPVPLGFDEANFEGVPHNGAFSLDNIGASKLYLIGNPYPSALDANAFLDANNTVLEGTLYFWTHKTPIRESGSGTRTYIYESDDYASYNRTGGVVTNPTPEVLLGKIASGQSFFAATNTGIPDNSQISFSNTMRVGVGGITGDNSQFFRMDTSSKKVTEKNRVWLNLANTQGAFKQTLVGYVSGATNEYEGSFDGESFDGNTYVDFYSINQDKNLTIQGRALPFDKTDQVPLGFKVGIDGTFEINIDHTDGFLDDYDIYLEDKNTGILNNLRKGSYSFSALKGRYNDRFVLSYKKSNSKPGLEHENGNSKGKAVIHTHEKQLTIKSKDGKIRTVLIYDLTGKLLCQKKDIDNEEVVISTIIPKNRIIIIKTSFDDSTTQTDKVIF